MTAHGGQQSAAEAVGNPDWLDVNNTYSYDGELFRRLRRDYAQQPTRPNVLIESIYENEHNSRPEQIRRQAYWAMTCGACGQFFGNSPIWHFTGPGVFKTRRSWKEELGGAGSRDMSRLRQAFAGRLWHRLVPEPKGKVVTAGVGTGTGTVTTALVEDGTLAMIYVPSTGKKPRALTIDLEPFAGPVEMTWFNPTTGRQTLATSSPLPNRGKHNLHTPGDNGSGTNDWLLIVEAAAAR